MTKSFFRRKRRILYAALSIMFYFFVLAEIERVTESVKDGLFFAASIIIPTLFPFMILSELVLSTVTASYGEKQFPTLFTRVTHLPRACGVALLLGILSGFPIGAKLTAMLYEKGALDRNSATRLLILSNHTGPAFMFGAISGLFHDARIPLFLLICELSVTLVYTAWLSAKPTKETATLSLASPVFPFSFLDAVENAMLSGLKIIGLVVSFRIVIDLLAVFIKSKLLLSFFSALFEIGNAVSRLSELYASHPVTALVLLAFAVSFGGISVHLQSLVFFRSVKISPLRYIFTKLVLGILSAALMSILLFVFKI